jgi:hypothetical protein
VILPVDMPARGEIDRLLQHRAPVSVSIYLPPTRHQTAIPSGSSSRPWPRRRRRSCAKRVLERALRDREVPGGGAVAAILRYPL